LDFHIFSTAEELTRIEDGPSIDNPPLVMALRKALLDGSSYATQCIQLNQRIQKLRRDIELRKKGLRVKKKEQTLIPIQ
jgi:hypothetical protein